MSLIESLGGVFNVTEHGVRLGVCWGVGLVLTRRPITLSLFLTFLSLLVDTLVRTNHNLY